MKSQRDCCLCAIIVLIFLACPWKTKAQSSVRDLEKYMTDLHKNPYESLPQSVLQDSKNAIRLLSVLEPFYNDTLTAVRQKAYYITKRIGQKSKDAAVQRTAVSRTAQALK